MSHPLLIRASIALNLVLAVVLAIVTHPQEEPAAAPTTVAAPLLATHPAGPTAPQSTRFPATASSSDQRRWLIDALRAFGVPNHTLARIVQANLDAEWTKHAGKVAIQCRGDPDTMAALQLEVDQSTDAEMRAALGEEGFQQWDRENMLREANTGKILLTAGETEAAYDAWKQLQRRELELKAARVNRTMDEADIGEAHGVALADYNRQMKALLGDERFALSQQADPATAAASFRQDLNEASPSETQFQELLKLQRQLNEQRAALDQQYQGNSTSTDYAAQMKALSEARDQEYLRVLGPHAFDALQKSQDAAYVQMKRNEALWGLNDDGIDSIYGTLKYYEKTVQEYYAQTRAREAQGEPVDWDAVNTSVKQFADQTEQSLKSNLGEERFNVLNRNGVFRLNEIPHQ